MVFVLADTFGVPRLEEEGVGEELIYHTADRPYVGVWEVVMADYHFWRTVFPRLDLFGEVVGMHAGISEVAYFEVNVFLQIDVYAFPLEVVKFFLGVLLLDLPLRGIIRHILIIIRVIGI